MARPILKRDNIERGVIEVVARQGLVATTIQDIATAADVSPGLLYRYWKNRDDLAADVYRRHIARVFDQLSQAAHGIDGVRERLRVMVRAFLKFADAEPVIVRFILLTQHDLADRIPPEEGVRYFIRELVARGVREGVLRQMNVDLAVHLAIGVVLQPVTGAVYGMIPPPLSDLGDELIGALDRVLAPKEPLRHDAAPALAKAQP